MIKILITLFILMINFKVIAGPFTNEIGITREPEVIEEAEVIEEPEEEIIVVETPEETASEDLFTEEPEETVKVVETEPEEVEIVTVLNIDPMLAYSLKDYILKGTALSKGRLKHFKEQKLKSLIEQKFQPRTLLKRVKLSKKLHLDMVFL